MTANRRRILVTGGAGFIGSNLVRRLVRAGREVLNLDKLTYAGNLDSLRDVCDLRNYRFVQVDLADAAATRRTVMEFAPQAVVHLAAESHVDRSIDGPRAFVESNVCGTFHLLQAAREHWANLPKKEAEQFRFIQASTDEVFGSLEAEGRFTEATPYAPRSPYSATKAAADHLARAWQATYGLPVIVTNSSNNYGPYQYPEKLAPLVILTCLRGDAIPVYGQGLNVRDWLHVDDHCAAMELVVEQGHPGESYNIGGDNERTNIDVVRKLCGILDELRPRPGGGSYAELISFVADRPGHDHRYAMDHAKITAELGWRPSFKGDDGFRETTAWYLENEAWWQKILAREQPLARIGLGIENRDP